MNVRISEIDCVVNSLGVGLEPLDKVDVILFLVLTVELASKLENNLMIFHREGLVVISPSNGEAHWS